MDAIAYRYPCAWTKLLTCARLAQKINDGVVCRLRLLGEHHVAESNDVNGPEVQCRDERGQIVRILNR